MSPTEPEMSFPATSSGFAKQHVFWPNLAM